MLLYYITDRSQFPGDEAARRSRLLATIAQAVRSGVDYIQIREKDLSPRELETLVIEICGPRTGNKKRKSVLLVNSRTDIALSGGADGVHLRSHDISPMEVRKIWTASGASAHARVTVSVSCHSASEVAAAAAQGVDFAVFGPVFEKKAVADIRPAGLDRLRQACREKIPVLALGGITVENASACMLAGAAGIAGIRLFQQNAIDKVVGRLLGSASR